MNRIANEPKLATEKCTLWFLFEFFLLSVYLCVYLYVYNYVHHYMQYYYVEQREMHKL